jgi:PTH1 family peptidyl-tRNA hydrolase
MGNIFDLLKQIGSDPSPKKPISAIVVGLGNPGKEYEATRHNMGFMAIDRLAEKNGVKIDRLRFKALTAECDIGNRRVLFMKPETFMNRSGDAVAEAARFYKIPPESIVVLCDDISFEPGKMRIRLRGSHGGHNGLRSIVDCLGSEDFVRLKLGVGQKPTKDYDLASWVLARFPKEAEAACQAVFDCAADAVTLILDGKCDRAMTLYSK